MDTLDLMDRLTGRTVVYVDHDRMLFVTWNGGGMLDLHTSDGDAVDCRTFAGYGECGHGDVGAATDEAREWIESALDGDEDA